MKRGTFILGALLSFFLINCSNDDSNTMSESLESIDVLGRWEVSARGTNNVTSAEAFCCETLELMDDSNPQDLKGIFSYDYGTITNGTFTVDLNDDVFIFTTEDDTTNSLYFNRDADQLEVWTFEGENRNWTTYNKTSDN